MSMVEIKVPDIGDFKEVEIIEMLVKAGDTVKADQSLITVESDKASMEIPSSHAGVVKEIKVKLGDKIAEGSLILVLEAEAEAEKAPEKAAEKTAEKTEAKPEVKPEVKEAAKAEVQTDAAKASAPAPAAAPKAEPAPSSVTAAPTQAAPAATSATAPSGDSSNAHASPSIRKFARELGVDLGKVNGSGQKGRITQEDVQSFVKSALAAGPTTAPAAAAPAAQNGGGLGLLAWPSLDFSKFGETTLQPLSRIKKISGPNLHRNWVMIPHVTQYDEADVTELEELRKSSNAANAKSGVKLTILAFVIKACVAALKKYPEFNSSLDAAGENLILKQYYNIGFAADTPNGLVVPVVKGADKKSVTQIAQEMGELSAQAREGKLSGADMQGATFTISSLGGIGGTYFTPLINAPEVAIIGLSKATMKPIWDGKQFVPRLIMPLSLSYDHRVIDGAGGARFVTYMSEVLGDLRKTLL
tara:strand:+ start:139147 stop:140562 length:1416 start_codon:yes stop_codon:yes gene_type:complete